MAIIENGAKEFRPALAMRIWRAMGFRYGAYAGRPERDEAIYQVHHVVTFWDWRDRLRILISGVTDTEILVGTEKLEKILEVQSEAVVLAPGLSRPKERARIAA